MSQTFCTHYGPCFTNFSLSHSTWFWILFSVRYWKGHVYSYTGPILIAVNPWKSVRTSFDIVIFVDVDQNSLLQVDIYNINVLERHKASACKEPHIFGVASRAFRFRFLIEQATRQQCDMATGFALQGADELKEKSVHSDIWRVRLRSQERQKAWSMFCRLCTGHYLHQFAFWQELWIWHEHWISGFDCIWWEPHRSIGIDWTTSYVDKSRSEIYLLLCSLLESCWLLIFIVLEAFGNAKTLRNVRIWFDEMRSHPRNLE